VIVFFCGWWWSKVVNGDSQIDDYRSMKWLEWWSKFWLTIVEVVVIMIVGVDLTRIVVVRFSSVYLNLKNVVGTCMSCIISVHDTYKYS
jgi:hypothetical protein